MSIREAVFLGTASQVPTRTRNHNAVFLFWDDLGILFDPGEGTQRQMTHAGIAATQITHVAITHFHGDHCLGLAGVVQRLSLDRVPHPVEVVYPRSGQPFFERLRHASAFHEVATLVPRPMRAERGGLTALHLGDNLIGTAGIEALLASPHLSNLQTLELANTAVQAAGGNRVGPVHRVKLRERFPAALTC